jgi:hypothetical protein
MMNKALRLAWALAATAGISCQLKDVQGWSVVKWGMSVSETKALFEDRAVEPTEKPGPNFVLIDRIIVKGVRIGDIRTEEVAVQTARDSDAVTAVTIRAVGINETPSIRSDAFATLKRLLIDKYGTPRNEDRKPSGRGAIDSIVLWSFPSTPITLLWSETSGYGLGYVTVQYRAVDKKILDSL